MSANFNTNTENKDEWLTPPEMIAALGVFDLDPCSPIVRPWPTAFQHYTREDNGLHKPWTGRVWLNPPYGKETFRWLDRLAFHGSGIALIFARTETRGFHRTIWEKAYSVFFFEGRISFYTVQGQKGGAANAPSCLVTYSAADAEAIDTALANRSIKGRHVMLNASGQYEKVAEIIKER